MAQPLKTVAVLIANPALSSILATTLAAAPPLRVRQFESELALRSYLRLAPADVLVTDFDSDAEAVAMRLRADNNIARRLQIIALAGAMSPERRDAAKLAGIDEIILKPMSPRYLLERVLARLRRAGAPELRRVARSRDWSAFGDNVVPLFPAEARPLL